MYIHRMGLKDAFGCSGTPEELLKHYGLTEAEIIRTIKTALKR
jgi:transketolase